MLMSSRLLAEGPVAAREAPARRSSTGFTPTSPALHRAYNLVLSSALFLLVFPLFAVISAALLATQGRSIFYFGPRLGMGQKPFNIIKFRTLDGEKAKLLTQGRVLPPGSGIETPLGGFLRDTRLDELPQLLNVVFGHMNLCGPRPVRPEIAEIYRREIPDYDRRFAVKPGLVGHTQAYMNHGASKFIRARYNAIVIPSPVNYPNEIAMVALVGLCVLARGASEAWRSVVAELTGRTRDAAAERARALRLGFTPDGGGAPLEVAALDDASIRLNLREGAVARIEGGRLSIRLPDGKRRVARLRLSPLGQDGGEEAAVFAYEPASDFAFHILSRYALQKVVVPHKAHLPYAAATRALSGLARPLASKSPALAGVDRLS